MKAIQEPRKDSARTGWRALCDAELSSLKCIKLPDDLQTPRLPAALTRFLEASNSPDYDIRQLGRIVEQDPGMTVDLLKIVNTAAHGALQAVKTPTDALVRLGVPRARNHLVAAGLKAATLALESRLMNHRNFWNESLRRALFAQQCARTLKVDADLAFIGGLLQDFVLPVLTNQYVEHYIRFLREAAPDGISLADWETENFGWSHASAAAVVARNWNLPDDLLCAILLHHRMELPLQSSDKELFQLFPVTLSALLPDQLQQVPGGVRQLLEADSRSEFLHLDELCRTVDDELTEMAGGEKRPQLLSPLIQQARTALAERP